MTKLKPCKTCNKEVSPNAKSCPNCGEENPAALFSKSFEEFIVGFVVLIVAFIIVAKWFSGGDSVDKKPLPETHKESLTRYISKYSGTVKKGLFDDGVVTGIASNSMINLINLYSYDVDFQNDVHEGDKLEVLVESFYTEEGKKVKDGNILFSSLKMQNRTLNFYIFNIEDRIEYFDDNGNSVRKSLLKNPINGGHNLGYSETQKGVIFNTTLGAPIFAVGSGVITYSTTNNNRGYIEIKHSEDYSTAYDYVGKFSDKIHNNSKVKQGDLIAYAGSSNLIFSIIYKGEKINPAIVKTSSAIKLSGKEKEIFEESKAEIDKYRKQVGDKKKVLEYIKPKTYEIKCSENYKLCKNNKDIININRNVAIEGGVSCKRAAEMKSDFEIDWGSWLSPNFSYFENGDSGIKYDKITLIDKIGMYANEFGGKMKKTTFCIYNIKTKKAEAWTE